MGMDEAKHNAEEAKGKVKETVGDWTDDQSLETEGKMDQAKAHMKQAGDEVKDAFTGDDN